MKLPGLTGDPGAGFGIGLLTGGTYIGGIGAIGAIGAGAKLPDESKTILSPKRLVVEPSGATVNGPCPLACA